MTKTSKADCQAIIKTLEELQAQCGVSIALIKTCGLINDPQSDSSPFDFKIGNFGVTRISGVDPLTGIECSDWNKARQISVRHP